MPSRETERGGDYIEQHYLLDLPRLEDAANDRELQIPIEDGVDVLTLDVTDGVRDKLD